MKLLLLEDSYYMRDLLEPVTRMEDNQCLKTVGPGYFALTCKPKLVLEDEYFSNDRLGTMRPVI